MKKTNIIKNLSAILVFAVLFSAFGIAKKSFCSAADNNDPVPPYTADEVLFNCDYNNNLTNMEYIDPNSWNKFGYLGDLTGKTSESNGYFVYAQSRSDKATLPIGYELFYNNMPNNTQGAWNTQAKFIPKSGATYKVEYDYMATGTVVQDLEVGLSVGYYYHLKESGPNLNPENLLFTADVKCEGDRITYKKDTVLDVNEWTHTVQYITVPASTTIDDNKDRLYLTFSGGGTGTTKPYFSVDNIKVTALAPDYLFKYNTNGGTSADGSPYEGYSFFSAEGGIKLPENPVNGNLEFGGWYTDEQLKNAYNPENYNTAQQALQTVELYAKWNDILLNSNDYEKATTRYSDEESAIPNYTSNLYEWSGHLSVINSTDVDSNDTHGKVIDYAQGNTNIASIVLGYDYMYQFIDEHDECYRVTPEAGKTYKVQYDYKITGTVYSKLKIGLAAGYYRYSRNTWGYDTAATKTVVETTDIAADAGNVYGDGVWRTSTAYITVPSDAEMPEKPRLYLTFSGGGTGNGKAHVYVDNVSVYETNKSETITIDGDVNGDKCIDDNDLTALRKMILGIKQENGYIYDVNRDNSVNILDLVSVKELIK